MASKLNTAGISKLEAAISKGLDALQKECVKQAQYFVAELNSLSEDRIVVRSGKVSRVEAVTKRGGKPLIYEVTVKLSAKLPKGSNTNQLDRKLMGIAKKTGYTADFDIARGEVMFTFYL